MLITGAIDSVRNLPATALFGSALIFFFVFATVFFLLPTALVSAELAATWTEQGGIYGWVKQAFGKKVALIAIWLQWANTIVWYPTILSFIAGTIAFLISPALAQNKTYLITVILSVFWGLTILNLFGLKASARFATACAIIGMIIPMLLIIGMGVMWFFSNHPSQLTINSSNIIPNFKNFDSWISLTAIITSFLGIELATVHVKQVVNPQKTFPKAMLFSSIIILLTMLLGSLAIAVVLPQSEINLVDGLMRAFTNFFKAYHLTYLLPVLTVMLVIGSMGGMINWVISPAKGLLNAAEDGYLPQILQKVNKHNVPSTMLLIQAVLVTICCIAFLYIPSINGSYWLLTDLSTQLYVMMYLMMFAAALRLRYKFPKVSSGFQIPGGKLGLWTICLSGLFGCSVALVIGFFPPTSIDFGGILKFESLFAGGILLLLLPVLVMISRPSSKALSEESASPQISK